MKDDLSFVIVRVPYIFNTAKTKKLLCKSGLAHHKLFWALQSSAPASFLNVSEEKFYHRLTKFGHDLEKSLVKGKHVFDDPICLN